MQGNGRERMRKALGTLLGCALGVLLAASPAPAGDQSDFPDTPPADRRIDWRSGYLYVFGSGAAPEATIPAARWQKGLQAAWEDAQAKLSDLSLGVPFDASRRVADLMGSDASRKIQKAWRGFLERAEPLIVYRRSDASVGLWVRAPLYGRGGLADILNRKYQEKGDKPGRTEEAPAPAGGSWLVLLLAPGSSWSNALWPVLLLPSGEKYADLPALAREGLLPPAFGIRWMRKDEAASDPTLPPLEGGGAWTIKPQENKVDVRVEDPGPATVFNPYAYRGILIFEP